MSNTFVTLTVTLHETCDLTEEELVREMKEFIAAKIAERAHSSITAADEVHGRLGLHRWHTKK